MVNRNHSVMVEVFKTNIQEKEEAKRLLTKLYTCFPENRINFDLHDCDKILRVEGENVCTEKVMEIVNSNGYLAEVLF